jgi:hypothetical protein
MLYRDVWSGTGSNEKLMRALLRHCFRNTSSS